ncbi:MAG: Ig-like domain-containing protein, partial [Planctomycetota bacterium]
VSPNVGSVQGGQQTTLTGTNFVAGTTVKIGNKLASVLTLVSATTMIVQVPASVPGPADVVVTNLNGDAVAQNGYTYLSGAPQKIGFITPTMGLINISRNVPVTVSFSRPVDRTSMTTSTFAFTQGATAVAGTFIFEFGDTVVTFRPTATLAASTAYTLSLTQGIKSVDGVPLDGPFIGSFMTGTGSDTVSPTITMTPIHGATNVPFNTSIVLTFSEPINPNTVNAATVLVMSQGEVRAGTITFGQQNTFAVFTPASPFFPTASATVTVLGQVTDTAGNLLQGTGGVGTSVMATFTTSSVADRLPPVVLQVLPVNAATGISTRTTITATFSESVNPNTITPTTFQVTSGGTPIAGSYLFTNLNQTVTFIPTAPLPPVATVNISISQISDVVGNVMVLPFTSSFQTQSAIDNIRPSVVRPSPSTFTFQSNPPTNTNVPLNFKPMIAFDERINPSTVTSTTFSMSANFATVPATVAVAPDGLSAVLTPNQPLVPNTIYSVSWTSGIQDLVGNQLFNPSTVSVTTGPVATDLVLPTVTHVSPAPGTQGAPINTVVVVQFSEPVSFTSITPQTVILATGGVPVA